jgi:HSP20 family protein
MRRSFFEKLTGSYRTEEENPPFPPADSDSPPRNFMEEIEQENEEGQLTVDVYQGPNEIVVQAFVAGLNPGDLDISLTREMVTIRGKRQDNRRVERDNFFYQELYWGSFARSILLPQEVDPDEAEAVLKNGLLTIRLPKLDKEKSQKIKIKAAGD